MVSALALTGQQAQAGTMFKGWNYSIDSFKDGTEGSTIGSKSKFEFYGMAFKETADKVIFAFNSNLSKQGYNYRSALGGKISYGDLMLDFTGKGSINQANGSLYGVRFDATNDTKGKLGLYNNVTTSSVTTQNAGYTSHNHHTGTVNNNLKGHASFGDMDTNTTYFKGTDAAQTTIAKGNYAGGITEINDFSAYGLNFGHFNAIGAHTFGFSIDKSLLPKGNFVASLFAECGNDGMVLVGRVPEPSVIIGLSAVGLMASASQLRKRRGQASATAEA